MSQSRLWKPSVGLLRNIRRSQQLRQYCSKDDNSEKGFLQELYERAEQADAKAKTSAAEFDNNALVPNNPERLHRNVFVVELARKPLFPGIYSPVLIHQSEKLIKEIVDLKKQGAQAYIGAFMKKPEGSSTTTINGEPTDPAGHLCEYGTFAQVHTIMAGDTPDSAQLLLLGHRRVRRVNTISSAPLVVSVEHLKDEVYKTDDSLKATSMEIVATLRDLLQLNPLYGEQFRTLLSLTGSIDLQDMSRLVDAAASLTSADEATLQEKVLQELNVPTRAREVLMLLKKEVELCRLQADIREQVEGKIAKEQRRMLLMEQLKSIKKELGLERDDKSALVQRFQSKWDAKASLAPAEVRAAVQGELEKLSGLEASSPEFNVTRTYLEWLTSLPWGVTTEELFDLDHAKQVLDADHYGLDDVKDRIMEFIAVSKLRGSAQGKILCLVGPPGVGKTSVGRSIANALNRKYFRFSVGGLSDVAEIKGHRRTYVGAMPGKLVQCLKATQSSNPLVLVDEIDKLGRGHSGDPASALLELLDPEQNSGFLDHYLDLPLDLSKVLFVCTANQLDTIPGPLLDRMEVIRLSGYAADEKVAIARRYLEPQAALEAGVPAGSSRLSDTALGALINEYCREAGVRNLKKHLDKIYRKIALKLVRAGAKVVPPPAGDQLGASTEAAVAPPSAAEPLLDVESENKFPKADPSASTPASADDSSRASSCPSSPSAPSTNTPPAAEEAGDDKASDGSSANSTDKDSTSSTSGSSDATDGSSGSSASSSAPATTPKPPTIVYEGEPLVIDLTDLKDFVGHPPFATDKFYDITPPGVVMGLAWTSMGGATLYVEAARVVNSDSKGTLTTTGQLGDVFRESTHIAQTYARAFLAKKAPANDFFQKAAVHVHVPAGATPKDGPSAGCTVVTALLSLALDLAVKKDVAMTGEVTLTGCVLPIGGVKEKVLAARRSGARLLVFPLGNKRDYDELSDEVKEGIEPHFVRTYDEIFNVVFDPVDLATSLESLKKEDPEKEDPVKDAASDSEEDGAH